MVFLRYYLWIGPHLILGVFLWRYLRRGLHQQLPWFFGYLVFEQFCFLTSAIATVLLAFDPKHSLALCRWLMVWELGPGRRSA